MATPCGTVTTYPPDLEQICGKCWIGMVKADDYRCRPIWRCPCCGQEAWRTPKEGE